MKQTPTSRTAACDLPAVQLYSALLPPANRSTPRGPTHPCRLLSATGRYHAAREAPPLTSTCTNTPVCCCLLTGHPFFAHTCEEKRRVHAIVLLLVQYQHVEPSHQSYRGSDAWGMQHARAEHACLARVPVAPETAQPCAAVPIQP